MRQRSCAPCATHARQSRRLPLRPFVLRPKSTMAFVSPQLRQQRLCLAAARSCTSAIAARSISVCACRHGLQRASVAKRGCSPHTAQSCSSPTVARWVAFVLPAPTNLRIRRDKIAGQPRGTWGALPYGEGPPRMSLKFVYLSGVDMSPDVPLMSPCPLHGLTL